MIALEGAVPWSRKEALRSMRGGQKVLRSFCHYEGLRPFSISTTYVLISTEAGLALKLYQANTMGEAMKIVE